MNLLDSRVLEKWGISLWAGFSFTSFIWYFSSSTSLLSYISVSLSHNMKMAGEMKVNGTYSSTLKANVVTKNHLWKARCAHCWILDQPHTLFNDTVFYEGHPFPHCQINMPAGAPNQLAGSSHPAGLSRWPTRTLLVRGAPPHTFRHTAQYSCVAQLVLLVPPKVPPSREHQPSLLCPTGHL